MNNSMGDPIIDGEVEIYSWGPFFVSVCAPKDMDKADVQIKVNEMVPTGIDSEWDFSKDDTFSGGEVNPSTCQDDKNKIHYLMNC